MLTIGSKGASSGEYFPAVDGLRAVAVLSVILYHVNQSWIAAGFVGVDVFFVISGFVVAASSVNLVRGGFLSFVTSFYARRITRIMPALLVCLVLTSLVSTLFIPSAWLSDSNAKTGLAAFFGVSNFFLAVGANDYFSPKTEFNPFTHTWSLGVEEQFYVVFPVIYFVWSRRLRPEQIFTTAFYGLAFLAVGSLAISAIWGVNSPVRAFYLLPARFWELACGVALFMSMGKWRPMLAGMGASAVSAASGLFAVGLVVSLVFADADRFPFPWAVVPVVCTLGLIATTVSAEGIVSTFLRSEPMRSIGRISYSLYLWHWPVIVLLRWTVGIEQAVQQTAAVIFSILLAVCSYEFVEKPFRNSSIIRSWPRGRVVVVGLFVTALCTGLSASMAIAKNSLTLSATKGRDWNPEGLVPEAEAAAKCELSSSSASFEGGFLNRYSSKKCHGGLRIFVIGDSHAVGYSSMLQAYVQRTGADVYLLGKGGCSIFNLRLPHASGSTECKKFSASAFEYLRKEIKAGDVLFLPSLRVQRLRDQWGGINPVQSEEKRAQLRLQAIDEAKRELEKISEKGAFVVWEAPKPIFRVPLFRCADWFNAMNPVCNGGENIDKGDLQRLREPALMALKELVAYVPKSSVWDPFPVLCPGVACSPYQNGRPLYFDGDHLSAYGNYYLLEDFLAYVSKVAGGGS